MLKLNKLTRKIVLLSLLAFVGVVGCSDSPSGPELVTLTIGVETPTVDLLAGMESYDTQCQGCHGAMGGGGTSGRALNAYAPGSFYSTFSNLQDKIHRTMPKGALGAAACEDACADDVSGHIYCEWNPTLVTSGCP